MASPSNQYRHQLVGAEIDAALGDMVKDGSWQKAAADMGKPIGYVRRVHESAEGYGQGSVLRNVRGIGKITAAHVPE